MVRTSKTLNTHSSRGQSLRNTSFTLAAALFFILVVTSRSFSQTATAPSGSGTSVDPYQIGSLENLYWITQNSTSWNKHFIQTADIDASSDTSWNSNQGFSPIGTTGTKFTGVYNGQGHTVIGIFISTGSANYMGMFAYADYPDTIENLGLINVNITGGTYTGGLVAFNYGGSTIVNCYTTGIITSTYSDYIGGLIGYNNASTVSNCYSTVNVTVNSASSYVGGLVGYNRGVSTISNCYTTGNVSNGGSYIGGLVGFSTPNGLPDPVISNSYSTGKVTGSSQVGALVGENDAEVDSCFWNSDSSGSTGIGAGTTSGATGKTTVQLKDPATFTAAGWDTASWYMGDGVNHGFAYLQWQYPSGTHLVTAVAPTTSSGTYLIASLDNLYWITQNSSSWGSSFKQTADIDASQTSGWASGSGFSPIGNGSTFFSGTFNGNGHSISNLFISRGSTSTIGFIGYAGPGATITGVTLLNENFSGGSGIGGLVGGSYATITNCYCTGNVSGNQSVGGLVGNSYGTISNCSSNANVSGYGYVGGLIGSVQSGNVTTSYSTGSVTVGTGGWGGGLLGLVQSGQVSNCYSTASISGSSAGGLIGINYSGTVNNCYSTGSVSGSGAGGLLSYDNSGPVNNSFWDTGTSGQSSSSGGTGETTASMKTYATFSGAGWDFASTWAMHSAVNNGYPYLRGITPVSSSSSSSPTAITQSASIVKITSALANGAVNSNSDTTVVRFLYGTTSGVYTDSIAASQSPLVPWDSINVSAGLSGLSPATTYYVRASASSSLGYIRGDEVSFTTRGFPALSSVPGSALSFNSASSQYISVPDNAALELTDNLTFEAWVYPTGSGNMAILDKGNYNYLFEIRPNGNTGLGLSSAWGWIYSAGSVPLNTWSHVAVVFQTGTNAVKFYLNGSLLSQHTAPGALTTNTGTFAIGEQAPGNCNCNFFQGMMDEVRVWGVARTEAQIQSDMHQTLTGTETGLISYWQLNEGSGTVTADSIAGNNGTLTNGPTWVTSEAPVGKYGAYDASSAADSAGQSGSNITGTITSPVDSLNFLGLYSYGSPTDPAVTTETFPSGIDKRWPVVWGIFDVGSDTADVSLSYNAMPGIQNESTLKVLQREEADSPWVDVTANFTQNTSNHTFTQSHVGTFSQFSIGAGSDNALPVQLASFTATPNRLSAQLKWTTSTQVDNEGWEVERKGTASMEYGVGSAENEWHDVDFVKGAGTSTQPMHYLFTDRNLTAGSYSYRLKQTDRSGAITYSQTVQVEVGSAPRVFTLSQNYPNPFNPTTTLEFTLAKDGRVTLKVYDILGREVATLLDENRKAGVYQQAVFDASRYSSGVYLAVLQSGGKQLLKKMVLLK